MKSLLRAFLLLSPVLFVACTSTSPDGTVTRFDGDAMVDGIRATGELVNQYQNAQMRQQYQRDYRNYQQPSYTQPVYKPYPVYPVTP